MSDLKEMYFRDFIKLNRGFDLPEEKIVPGEYPIAASTSIKAYHHQYKVKRPCVTTGRSGSLGTVLYIDKECYPLNTSLYVKDFKGNNPRYVFYFLQMMKLQNFNSGAGVPSLNQNHLHALKLKVHKKEEQPFIASILSTYDDLIENTNKRIALLEQMAEQIYKEWFVRMRFPGYENVEFKKGVPKGWEIKQVKDFGKVVTGKTPSTFNSRYYNGQYLFIKTPDMHGNVFVLQTEETLTEDGFSSQKSQILPANSICVSCIGTGGIVSITPSICMTNQQINSLILKNQKELEFLFFTFRGLKTMIEMFGSTGATMTNLSKGKFENLKFIKPNDELIERFCLLTKPMLVEIKNLSHQQIILKQTRNLLLPRLISGKLRVKEIKENA
jgi:type I restriction enzyme S subunit